MQTTTFAELGLSAKVQAAIQAAGYTTPTPIQVQAIPVAVTGRDVLGIAQTGTGKTAGFVLPMLARLETGRARARMPRSLILAPTRELAAQVAQSFEKYGINHKLTVALLIGGVSFDDQLRKLDRGVDVLIATPGPPARPLRARQDPADRRRDPRHRRGRPHARHGLHPRHRAHLQAAAAAPADAVLLGHHAAGDHSAWSTPSSRTRCASRSPRPATAAATITQLFRYCPSTEDWEKREVLRELIRSENVKNAIIFCNRKRDVAILLKSLQKHGFNAGALHGDMDQMSRTATLDAFREGRITLLAASDVAARGLDIPDVSHIFNFDVPWQSDDYVHRIGRTGRAGKEGRSLTLVTPDDAKQLKDIERCWARRSPGSARRRAPRTWRAASAGADAASRPRRWPSGRSARRREARQVGRPHARPRRRAQQRQRRQQAHRARSRAGRERQPQQATSRTASVSPSSAAPATAAAFARASMDARTRRHARDRSEAIATQQPREPSQAAPPGEAARGSPGSRASPAQAQRSRPRRSQAGAGRPRRSRAGVPEEDDAHGGSPRPHSAAALRVGLARNADPIACDNRVDQPCTANVMLRCRHDARSYRQSVASQILADLWSRRRRRPGGARRVSR